ncbi:Uma2 family endonuclease [Leptolyngbya sp. BC1307]|uniref:Uma2 family endonuclease n=1 Tax=Leptolyngbya sp. BC1307 TaxID=2029589 RepID=UPI000EFA6B60|nr:Uma2 family endonuclease [Leptolyngbya sp. BC1307]
MVTTSYKAIGQAALSVPDSLEAWLDNPLEGTEWANDHLIEKSGITVKHSRAQRLLSTLWANYQTNQALGGEVYTELPCQTNQQGRKPDIAYLTPELLEQYGNVKVVPQSAPLIAEIVSPTDLAEEMIAKAYEYLASGGQEVWLVYPEVRWIIVVTAESKQIFGPSEIAETRLVLPGFSVTVDELLNG